RRLALPTSIAYLVVGLVLGPHALGVLSDSGATRLLAELGVAFLLFTLGLEFSLPRMLAMRREVLGLGAAQVTATAGVFALCGHLLGITWQVPAGSEHAGGGDRKSIRLNSSHVASSYAVFCLKKNELRQRDTQGPRF